MTHQWERTCRVAKNFSFLKRPMCKPTTLAYRVALQAILSVKGLLSWDRKIRRDPRVLWWGPRMMWGIGQRLLGLVPISLVKLTMEELSKRLVALASTEVVARGICNKTSYVTASNSNTSNKIIPITLNYNMIAILRGNSARCFPRTICNFWRMWIGRAIRTWNLSRIPTSSAPLTPAATCQPQRKPPTWWTPPANTSDSKSTF